VDDKHKSVAFDCNNPSVLNIRQRDESE